MSKTVKISELPVATVVQQGDHVLGNADGVTSRIAVNSPNGVLILDSQGKVSSSKLPAIAITDVFVVESIAQRDELVVESGDVAKVTDDNLTFIYDGSEWVEIVASYAVDSVNGETGVVVLSTTDIGEGENLYFTKERAEEAAIPLAFSL